MPTPRIWTNGPDGSGADPQYGPAVRPSRLLPLCAAALLVATAAPGGASATPVTADLSITATAPAQRLAGQTVTYGVTVTNTGPDAAPSAQWSLTLPAGTTFVSETATNGTAASFSCTAPPATPGAVACTTASLAAGGTATFTLVLQLDSGVTDGSTVTATFVAASGASDPNPSNGLSAASTTVGTQAELSHTLVDSPDPVVAAQMLSYSGTVTNAGPSTSRAPKLSVNVPVGTRYVDFAAPPGATCAYSEPFGSGPTVDCDLADLPPGSIFYTLRVRVRPTSSAATLQESAVVLPTTPDSVPSDDVGRATTTVVPLHAALSLTPTAPESVTAGGPWTSSVTVTNLGPDPAYEVRAGALATTPGLTLGTLSSSPGSCPGEFAGLQCSVDVLPAGQSATIAAPGTVAARTAKGTALTVLFQAAAANAMAAQATATSTVVDPATGPGTGPPATTPPGTTPPGTTAAGTAEAVLLTCAGVQLRLVTVAPAGARVRVAGLALRRYAGQRVAIRSGSRALGTATVQPDGTFTATVRRPAGTTAAITARLGAVTSAALRVERRLSVAVGRATAAGVRLTGRLTSAKGARRSLTLRRLVGCRKTEPVATTRTDGRGRFAVTAPRPDATVGVVAYRVTTTSGGATFSLPVLVRSD